VTPRESTGKGHLGIFAVLLEWHKVLSSEALGGALASF